MKTCTGCGQTKAIDEYQREKKSRDGRRTRCKTCSAEERRAHYAKNREAVAEWGRKYRANNREAIAERTRATRQANAEVVAARRQAYHQANPHVAWEYSYRRRIRRRGLNPAVERFTRAELIAKYGDKCWHCGGPFQELDHHPVPVREGGPHTIENCRPSCTPCNRDGWKTSAA